MSIKDFQGIIDRYAPLIDGSPEGLSALSLLYEEFIRYIAKGGVNSHHACKIARMLMTQLDIAKKV